MFVSVFFTTDTQRGLHDSFKWTCSSLYIWRCHVSLSGASKPGYAFESQQLPLPRAKAHCVRGVIRLSKKRVGNPSQLSQSLHFTREYTLRMQLVPVHLQKKFVMRFCNLRQHLKDVIFSCSFLQVFAFNSVTTFCCADVLAPHSCLLCEKLALFPASVLVSIGLTEYSKPSQNAAISEA